MGRTGRFTVAAQPIAGLVRAPDPVTVTLSDPGEAAHMDFQYDTGIQ